MANISTASQEEAAAAAAANADKAIEEASEANNGELPPSLEKPDEDMEDAFVPPVKDAVAELREKEKLAREQIDNIMVTPIIDKFAPKDLE